MVSLKSGQKLLSGQWESRASIPGTLALHDYERLQFQGGCGARYIGKSLPWKHKDLSSAPHSTQNPCKKTGMVVYTYLSTEEVETGRSSGSLARQCSYMVSSKTSIKTVDST